MQPSPPLCSLQCMQQRQALLLSAMTLGVPCALAPVSLQALALLDALAGGGGAFWERYMSALLPPPAALALPCCLPDPPLLGELQHGAIIEGARAQKARLQGLFPGLAQPMSEGASADCLLRSCAAVQAIK